MKNNFKKNKNGFVALIFVIMITSIFIVSSVIIAMVNTSNNMANYHSLESNDVLYNLDACLSDALWQIASTTEAVGDYSIAVEGVNCAYQISATNSGLKTVTSTATTTSGVGSWSRSVVMQVNVSSSPFFIQSHKDYIAGVCLNNSCCYDGICNDTESCTSCSDDCGTCPVCGNGVPESGEQCDDGNLDNTDACLNSCLNWSCGDGYVRAGTETCDDGNILVEACGDGIKQNGTYCDATCSATIVRSEACDYESLDCPSGGAGTAIGCATRPYCNSTCTVCVTSCPA
ncbi:MAG: hypothetical protein QG603_756 [Patescibacteria group bacterium]|nr:hypothetical protein [Patescibacteria group bacterium]